MSVIGEFCKRSCARWILVILMLLFELGPSGGHEIVKFAVPLLADPRENANLACHYNMGEDHLFSAKWFKEDQEIFRYMPGQEPPDLSFPVNGIHLRPPTCSPMACDLELLDISPSTAGLYRCEVSTEAPTFRIVQKSANLTVAALPQRDPKVEGLASRYFVGDEIRVNCTSDPSLPPAELTWYVNDREASFLNVEGPWENGPSHRGLSSRSLGLRLPAEKGLFRDDGRYGSVMKIECVAELPSNLPTEQHRRHTVTSTHLVSYLTNEKLAWPGSGAFTSVPCAKIVLLHLILHLLIRSVFTWRPCGVHLSA